MNDSDNPILRDRNYAAAWCGGFIDEQQPFVSLQVADAKTGPDGQPIAAPAAEIRELIFTDPQQLVDFLARGFEVAAKMFPADVDHIRVALKRRLH